MELRNYQEKAVRKLLDEAEDLLRRDASKRLVFESPTGSGKTVMAAEFLKRLAEARAGRPFACVWLSPGKGELLLQSMRKLQRYYAESRALDCVEFDEVQERQIGDRQVLFLNWEKVRQKENIIIRENERDMYLKRVLKNTRDEGRQIIALVDESHYHRTAIAEDLIDTINPTLIVRMSATPEASSVDAWVKVQLDDVKAEGVIKKSVVVNPGFANAVGGDRGRLTLTKRSEVFVLEQGLQMRLRLADAFAKTGAAVNPLLCIQIDNNRSGQDDSVREAVEETLRAHDITVDNGKFAVWLANEKANIDKISANDDAAEVLLFKQAIALGWDCPRAQILVLFRQWHSEIFSVQTLGRIMRMPEPEAGHYADESLNNGYVYTNLPQVEIKEDMSDGYVQIFTSQRGAEYEPLRLRSVHRLEQRERTRIAPRFSALFLQAAEEMNLRGQIDTETRQVSTQFINEYKLDNINKMRDVMAAELKVDVGNDAELQRLFDYFARTHSDPYSPQERTVGNVKKAIYEFFAGPLEMGNTTHWRTIISIVLSERNSRHFVAALARAKEKYHAETDARVVPLQWTEEWEVPASLTFGEQHREYEAAKSIMQPFYSGKLSEPEEKFIAYLNGEANVRWWYKNGDHGAQYFAVPYYKLGEETPFYVDFIVQLHDGRVGLFDTKSGFTAAEAGDKSEGLLAYIAEANRTRPERQLFGGIVTPFGHGDVFKVYGGKGRDLRKSDIAEWDWLDLS